MAFFGKIGNILKQTATVSRQINSDLSVSSPSIFQAIRCMSTSNKLFVGGINYTMDSQSLKEAFSQYGEVIDARIINDRESGRSRGFGFVTYTSSEEASTAIQALDGQELQGRVVRVNYAAERARSNFGGGGYGGGGGFGGAGYGGGGGFGGAGYGGSSGGYGSGDAGGYNSGYGGGAGGNYGAPEAGNYGGSTGSFGNASNFDNSNYGSGSGSSNFSVAGGGGGTDSFSSGGALDSSSGIGFDAGDNQFASNETSTMDNSSGGAEQVGPLEGNFRDNDDEPDDFAKRA